MLTIYSKPNCPNCDSMKAMLTKNQVLYTIKDVTQDGIKDELFYLLPSARSVPQVFEGTRWIGSRVEEVRNALETL